MSTAEELSNKATFKRFHEAANTCDAEFLSKTIDELVEPDATIRTPLRIDATGAELLKQVWVMLLPRLPRPSPHRPGRDRGGGQGRRAQHGHRNPPG